MFIKLTYIISFNNKQEHTGQSGTLTANLKDKQYMCHIE